MIAADALEESRSPNQKEGEPVSEEGAAEQLSVSKTAEKPSVLENEAMIASKESESPNHQGG
jgi:hypothetical protein